VVGTVEVVRSDVKWRCRLDSCGSG